MILSCTRFAPTPNGYLHLGNFYNLIWISLLASRDQLRVGLRIDDYDQTRYRSHFVDDIFRVLDLAKFEWQQGPTSTLDFESHHSSRHRKEWYHQAINKLKSSSQTYWCTCTRKMQPQLIYSGRCRDLNRKESDVENGMSARLRFQVRSEFLKSAMGDFIVAPRGDELSYQLASIVDDVRMGYDCLIRGEDLRASSEAQLELAPEAGLPEFLKTKFFHHALITDGSGLKLSKSQHSQSVLERLKAPNGLEQILTEFAQTQLGWVGQGMVAPSLEEFCQRFKNNDLGF